MSDPSMPPPGTPPPPPPPPMGAPVQQSNGMAVAALVLGILAIVTFWIPFFNIVSIIMGIVALILGFLGRGRSKQPGVGGGGMAMTGIILGALAIVLSILVYVGALALFNTAANDPEFQDAIDDITSELNALPTP